MPSCNSFQEAFSYPHVIYYEAGKEAACRFVNHFGSFSQTGWDPGSRHGFFSVESSERRDVMSCIGYNHEQHT